MTRIAVLVLACCAGCSFATVRTRPQTPAEAPATCEGRGAPVVDIALAVGTAAAGTSTAFSELTKDGHGEASERGPHFLPVYALGAATVAFAASAIYGFAANTKCRAALPPADHGQEPIVGGDTARLDLPLPARPSRLWKMR